MAQPALLDRGRLALLVCALAVLAGAFMLGRALSASHQAAEPVLHLTPLAAPATSVQAPPALPKIGALPRPHKAAKKAPSTGGSAGAAAPAVTPSPAPSSTPTRKSPGKPHITAPVGGDGNL